MLKVWIAAQDPRLANDMADVVRIFYGQINYTVTDASPVPGPDEMLLILREERTDGLVDVTVRAEGAVSGEARQRCADCPDALEFKRRRKRAVKLAVYALMKHATGVQPPWGALTGIRPTRLVYQRMEAGETLSGALDWVRDTFDVTPAKAELLGQIVSVQRALPPPSPRQVELYVGIPFCVSRCTYCSFSSGEIGNGALVDPYVTALLDEIAGVRELLDARGLTVSTVYIGGGTPTALPAPALRRVLEALVPWTQGKEFTVEAGRPDTIDREKLRIMQSVGVTRISINPQTFHDPTLERIGRRHTSAQTLQAYALARSLGFDDINMDLIAGLPGEDLAIFLSSLDQARSLRPDSLTVHSLAIKHASALHLYGVPLPDGRMTAGMMDAAAACAHGMGLRPYYMYRQKYMAGALENVAYALPGRECLYNVRMMEETGHIIALGAGGISKRVAPTGGKIVRAPNVGDIAEYIRRVGEMVQRKRDLWSVKDFDMSLEPPPDQER